MDVRKRVDVSVDVRERDGVWMLAFAALPLQKGLDPSTASKS